ncbi:S8 family serine peptidase [Aliikangiella coralliicola]|uniref:S8 family serine peptidase n=1 Tax=Aliikangiella coralliicola TaxID=2592383 RepID=A0A545UHC1_9GAMM|nr:S8 family serine peptidase [Aliikangiella coralliicola]TQV88859.1 S8 family serine peptidase [Aliikangiella coralliicola]
MNKKLITAVSAAIYSASIGASAISTSDRSETPMLQSATPIVSKSVFKNFVRPSIDRKIKIEEGLEGAHVYMVRLKALPVAVYKGSIPGYAATSPTKKNSGKGKNNKATNQKQANDIKFDINKPEVKAYVSYLKAQQNQVFSKIKSKIGNVEKLRTYQYSLNAMKLKLTHQQAIDIAKMNEVEFVERSQPFMYDTDTGPTHIGAPEVWNGNATGTGTSGEGIIIGILDTGVNTDNIAFADVGGDGYDHTNPNGAGNYFGDCAGSFPELCNDKLIGVHSYPIITDVYQDAAVFGANPPAANGEDYNGHGSHTASTAGGNVLNDVPMLDRVSGVEESDGVNSTGFEFPQMSGVAPHANIISYQVCRPGNRGDTYTSCNWNFVSNDAVEDAITEGVDVINYSIGGGGAWGSSTELAFLSAQQAGIFVAVSAGNSGPNPETTSKGAPWYTTVAASTHGRTVQFPKTIGDFTGGDTTLDPLDGSSATPGITAPIVYAGDFDNPNDGPDDDSAQCLAPFPANTFSGQIVVCDRGAIARVAKAENVAAGGAGGYVLANLQGGATNVANDVYVVPGIHIDADSGDALKTWLSSGADHMATIASSSGTSVIGQADDLAGFSSRGPNFVVRDVLSPSVAAPGVSIYAAYADQHFGHDVTGPSPADFAFLQGTSMASPHVAGAAALLKAAHPTWTPDNIRSALALTATTDMRKEDGETAADMFDMGSGRVRVDVAAKSGLIMDESYENYIAANPATGGDPTTLNLPSFGDGTCESSCSWQRTFTATQDATWTAAGAAATGNVTVTVEPATFTLAAGETQTITVTANLERSVRTGEYVRGSVTLTPDNAEIPTARLPLFARARTSDVPKKFEQDVHRDAGSIVVRGVMTQEITEFTARSYGMTKANVEELSAAQDSEATTPFDSLTDGVSLSWINLAEDSPLLLARTANTLAANLQLFVGLDDGDGVPHEDEMICASVNAGSAESCEIEKVDAGNYWIIVQNAQASATDATDTFDLISGYVANTSSDNLSVTAESRVDAFSPYDLRVSWNGDMTEGDLFIGAFDLGTDAANPGNLGVTSVLLTRAQNDVSVAVDNASPMVGDQVTFTVTVDANMTDEDATYFVETSIPEGISIDETSITASHGSASVISGGFEGTRVSWGGVRQGLLGVEPVFLTTDNTSDASCTMPNFGQGGGYIDLASFNISPQPLTGDTVSSTFSIPTNFLGEIYPSIRITDDGFVTVTTTSGSRPWVNQLLPSSVTPNGVIAPLWRDMQLDTASGSAAYVATVGSTWTIIEFDDMRHFDFYDGNPAIDDVLDFEIVINNVTGDIMFGYDNVTHNVGNGLPTTVGWENVTGTSGANRIYTGSAGAQVGSVTDITSGLIICNRLQPVDDSAVTITFTGTVSADIAGADLTITATSESSNIGAKAEDSTTSLKVQSNLALTAIADGTVAEEATLTGVTVEYTDVDSVDNTITVSSDNGSMANLSGHASGATFDITPNENFTGDMVVTVTITDNEKPTDSVSTSFTVAVTPVNDAPTAALSYSESFTNAINTLTLTAVGSDVDGDDLTYSWSQVSGPSVTITNSDMAVATVSNANAETGTLVFELTVSDGTLESKSTISVGVTQNRTSGSGSVAWLLLVMLSLVGLRRRR